jgi:hypothetical protein
MQHIQINPFFEEKEAHLKILVLNSPQIRKIQTSNLNYKNNKQRNYSQIGLVI